MRSDGVMGVQGSPPPTREKLIKVNGTRERSSAPREKGHSGTYCVSVPQSLWVERTSLFLVQSLPGISRWFEVDKREVVRPKLL